MPTKFNPDGATPANPLSSAMVGPHGHALVGHVAPKIDINVLIDAITDMNRHDEIDMGPPLGDEVW